MRLSATLLLAAWLGLSAALPASAVIINGGDGSGNITAPTGDQGWSYVGGVNGATGVYLGNGWVITAYHVGGNLSNDTFTLNSVAYAPVAGSLHQLTNTSDASPADLAMYQLQTIPPDLSGLSIAGGAYDTSMVFTAIGIGRNRAALPSYWNADWTTAPDEASATYSGYAWASGLTKRWGTNTLAETTPTVQDDGSGIQVALLPTTFDADGGDNEMQAADKDSGGGVFVQQNGVWNLAGIILAIGEVEGSIPQNRPFETAVYGDQTYFADLREYSGQIQQIMGVPEPSRLDAVGHRRHCRSPPMAAKKCPRCRSCLG